VRWVNDLVGGRDVGSDACDLELVSLEIQRDGVSRRGFILKEEGRTWRWKGCGLPSSGKKGVRRQLRGFVASQEERTVDDHQVDHFALLQHNSVGLRTIDVGVDRFGSHRERGVEHGSLRRGEGLRKDGDISTGKKKKACGETYDVVEGSSVNSIVLRQLVSDWVRPAEIKKKRRTKVSKVTPSSIRRLGVYCSSTTTGTIPKSSMRPSSAW
jgi:hypothetical protein